MWQKKNEIQKPVVLQLGLKLSFLRIINNAVVWTEIEKPEPGLLMTIESILAENL